MRHRRNNVKLGRSQAHRDALLSNLAVNLIWHDRITTTVAKAKAVRPYVEKLVTKAKKDTLHARRLVLAELRQNVRAMKLLFSKVAPRCANRQGGYTRILKLGPRYGDAAPMALLEWVDCAPEEVTAVPEKTSAGKKPAVKKAAPKKGAAKTSTEEAADAESEPAKKKAAPKKPRAKKAASEEGEEK
ncbi:MAG: 50S ribosomal protein L17 [Chthoniobacteraceae bacterium]